MNIIRIAFTLLLAAAGCSANFILGDFVPTARKAQFHGERTQWHDVLGAHCPKFGVNSVVAMPIPQPTGFDSAFDYKLQLSFDGDRVITPWFQLIGRRAPLAPVLIVELTRSGDALVGANAKIESLPSSDIHYTRVRHEFADPTAWPKHLPVYYRWKARHEVDVFRGLFVLFTLGAAAMLLAAVSIAKTYNKQLKQFMEDVSGENRFSSSGGGGSISFGDAKAD